MKKIGFTIGKYAPLHKGHQYLINKALYEMDELYIIIYETNVIKIPIEIRADWLKVLYPQAKILYAYNPPSKIGLDKESVEIQINYLKNILGDIKITHFYSSEEYGKCVAEYLNVKDCRIDSQRKIIPMSATIIRNDIEKNKQFLEDFVYNDCIKYLK